MKERIHYCELEETMHSGITYHCSCWCRTCWIEPMMEKVYEQLAKRFSIKKVDVRMLFYEGENQDAKVR